MEIYRGVDKTHWAIDIAAEQQDLGKEVIYMVPEESYLDHLYPLFIETLDMSRVMIYTQGQVQLTRGVDAAIIVSDLHLWEFEHAQELYALPLVFATSN